MRVFEVICEYPDQKSDAIITERQYVTAEQDTIKAVTDYFTEYCYQYEKELKSIGEVLIIVQHIPKSEES